MNIELQNLLNNPTLGWVHFFVSPMNHLDPQSPLEGMLWMRFFMPHPLESGTDLGMLPVDRLEPQSPLEGTSVN
jgi:hypothetical protein